MPSSESLSSGFLLKILYPMNAIVMDISGEMRLKKQYGKYSNVETFSTMPTHTSI